MNTPQQSWIDYRKNGHLLNITRPLLFCQDIPKTYWGKIVLTYVFIINIAKLYADLRTTNNFTHKIFSSTTYVHIRSPRRGNLILFIDGFKGSSPFELTHNKFKKKKKNECRLVESGKRNPVAWGSW